MNELGNYALCLSWGLALLGMIFGFYGGVKQSRAWTLSAVRATWLVTVCCLISLTALGVVFWQSDFANEYVWQFSNRDMPSIYRVSAIWGGMDGSMLLWAAFLSISTGIAAARSGTYPKRLTPYLMAVLNSSQLFFLTICLFLTNPFRYIKTDFVLPDGNGLNPLLQNPYMAIHPPTLYLGFTTLAVPFAFCMAALLAGKLDNTWIKLTRRWTLIAWGFLTLGITLGGYWAYIELGWGGFWAWDPVENASFMPWLTATAFLHSVMVQEQKGMLKIWNIWLIVLSYALTVFGTFLTRSGVVQSVHAFASTDVGWVFLLYLGIIVGGALILTWYRRDSLRSERTIDSLWSREAAFLLNNLVFLSILFATLWGVMFPILSEAVTGTKQAVSIPFFNAVNVPLFLLMLLLMGVGPLIAWRRANLASLRKSFLFPAITAFVAGGALLAAGITDFWALSSYVLVLFVFLCMLGDIHRAMRSGRVGPDHAAKIVRKNRHRYAAFLVHFGVLIATIGITASMAHKVEEQFSLARGESYAIGNYQIRLDDIGPRRTPNFEALAAELSILTKDGEKKLTTLSPELRFYLRNSETTTEVSIKKGWWEDLYLVLAGTDESETRATFRVFVNPLQVWLWIGVFLMAIGTLFVIVFHESTAKGSTTRESAPEPTGAG